MLHEFPGVLKEVTIKQKATTLKIEVPFSTNVVTMAAQLKDQGVIISGPFVVEFQDPNDHPDQTYIDEDHGEGYEGEDE
jgi:hypothetical protein